MPLTIYGAPQSRALRVLWMAKELGLDYKSVPTSPRGETRTPEFLKINANGHVPVIDDDGLIIWESMACNLYLAKKHGGPLQPKSIADEARTMQWSFWAMTELESQALPLLFKAIMPDRTTDAAVAAANEKLPEVLKVLDGALAGKDYLLGANFSAADLNVASVLNFLVMIKYDLKGFPNVAAWAGRCLSRPALAAAAA